MAKCSGGLRTCLSNFMFGLFSENGSISERTVKLLGQVKKESSFSSGFFESDDEGGPYYLLFYYFCF